MNRKLFPILTAMMWLALPLTAVRYWQVWDQLPERMATHFGAGGEPTAGCHAKSRSTSRLASRRSCS